MRILVVLPRFPFPLDKGDKLRAYHQIVQLSKRHDVYLFALSHSHVAHDSYEQLKCYCKQVECVRIRWWESAIGLLAALLSRKPLQLGYWTSPHARRAYMRCEQQVHPDIVYCQMVRTMPLLKNEELRMKNEESPNNSSLFTLHSSFKVLDYQDALSLNTRRRMEKSRGPMRLLLHYEYRALQRVEQQALRLFDATTIISNIDRDAISPNVVLVPNGVDTEYFKNDELRIKNEESPNRDSNNSSLFTHHSSFSIVFTGNMSYAPNVDAAQYLVKEIMPLVWSRIPSATLLLAGADPKPAVRALEGPRVTVSGRLPDIRTAYASAKIFVAPMRIGSGMQNKLLEAMSMGLPCVTTSIAATPLGATPGEHLLVGDTAEEIADLIVKLTIEETHHLIADGGHRFVQERYSWAAAVEPLEHLFYAQLESK